MQFNFATVAFVAAAMTSLAAALPQSLLTELPADFEPGPVSGPELILEPVEVGDTTQPDLEKRQGRIIAYLYRDSNFNGENRALGTFPGQCGNTPADFNDVISSIASPYGNCEFWTNGGCTGARLYVPKYGGYPTLPAGFNDAISSARCS